jgi:hypothetical protein
MQHRELHHHSESQNNARRVQKSIQQRLWKLLQSHLTTTLRTDSRTHTTRTSDGSSLRRGHDSAANSDSSSQPGIGEFSASDVWEGTESPFSFRDPYSSFRNHYRRTPYMEQTPEWHEEDVSTDVLDNKPRLARTRSSLGISHASSNRLRLARVHSCPVNHNTSPEIYPPHDGKDLYAPSRLGLEDATCIANDQPYLDDIEEHVDIPIGQDWHFNGEVLNCTHDWQRRAYT